MDPPKQNSAFNFQKKKALNLIFWQFASLSLPLTSLPLKKGLKYTGSNGFPVYQPRADLYTRLCRWVAKSITDVIEHQFQQLQESDAHVQAYTGELNAAGEVVSDA